MIDPEMMEDDEPEETPQLSPFKMYMNEHGRVVKAVVATFFITSLLWAFVLLMVFNKAVGDKTPRDKAVEVAGQVTASQQQKALAPRYEATAKKDVDYSQVIVGHWEPVEVSSFKLDFSQYGTLKTTTNKAKAFYSNKGFTNVEVTTKLRIDIISLILRYIYFRF